MSGVNEFNFCTGHSPTVPLIWNSLLFQVAVLHFVVPILGAEHVQIGGGGSVAVTWFNPGSKFVHFVIAVSSDTGIVQRRTYFLLSHSVCCGAKVHVCGIQCQDY